LQQCVHSSKNAAAKITGKADDRPCQAGQHLIAAADHGRRAAGMAVPPRAAEDLGRLLVRVAAPPRAAEGLGRLPVRVVVPPLGAADRGRRAVPTAAQSDIRRSDPKICPDCLREPLAIAYTI
jgi:hypothetical protein